MITRRRTSALVLASTVALVALSTAACGQQVDERVAGASPSADASMASESSAAEAAVPSQSAPAAAMSPFVTVNCVTGAVTPVDAAPQGTTLGPVTVSSAADGSPEITVATDAQPATELMTADIATGSGPAASMENTLTVDYCGVGLGSKALFDSSWANGSPATFPLNGVIAGWQQGMPGLQAGGSRLLVIPGELAYGENPPPGILPNETLVFLVDLKSVN